MTLARSRWADLPTETAYALLALRAAVFVVEQHCAYLDADGRDLEPEAEQWWIAEGDRVVSCLRVLVEPEAPGVRRIGRVATAPDARGRGLATLLMRAVLAAYPGVELVLAAQTQLTDWYAGFGFVAEDEIYVEDGIPHRSMRRAGVLSAS